MTEEAQNAETIVGAEEETRSFAEVAEDEAKEQEEKESEDAQASQADEAEDDTEEDAAESDEDGSEDDGEPDTDEPQTVTWTDDNGREWAVPEELTPALMKDKDYRQKTQTLADSKREFEAQQEEFEALQKRSDEDFAIEAEINSLRETLKQYDGLDWNRMAAEDMYDAQQKQFQRGLVKDRLTELSEVRNSRHQERLAEAQRETAKRISEAETYAQENIPGWEQGKGAEIIGFAREIGYDDQSLRKNMGAPFMKMLHRAFVGNQAMTKAKEQPKPPKKQVKPASKVNGQSETTKRVKLADADIATYEAARKSGANPRLIDL